MEFFSMDSDCGKMNRMTSSWHNVVVLVGLLLALNLAAFLTELSQETVRRSVSECLVTLGVKFLNFCIAKSTQFRYAGPMQAQPSFMPLVFWYTLAQSVSSLYS
ncbi:uncharacterized protein LOC131021752 [Salvia miltiorrhiza]|uniref:uncharacterized protein LOC131021752 n=1 Tax=Salvia miltiorrhiza TaxID=226208 RepID=UPI0025ACF8FC|nr:uncharacterized protein LOC131021752 [Salvia miltiorrhiza]